MKERVEEYLKSYEENAPLAVYEDCELYLNPTITYSLIRDLWEENQILKGDIKCYENDIEKHYERARIYRELLQDVYSAVKTQNGRCFSANFIDMENLVVDWLVRTKQALNTEVTKVL